MTISDVFRLMGVVLASHAGLWVTPVLAVGDALPFAALEERLYDHPALVALRSSADADRALARAARALPDPAVSLGINNLPINNPAFDRFLPTNKSVAVRQEIPNWSARKARSAQLGGKALSNDLLAAWRFAQLRSELIALLAQKERIVTQLALLREQDAKYAELINVIASEIEAGRAVVYRLPQIDVERANSSARVAQLESEAIGVAARLVDLVGFDAATIPPNQTLIQWDGNPRSFYSVQLADAGIEVAGAQLAEARAAYRPNWGVNLTYQEREQGSGGPMSSFSGEDWASATVSFTIPLWASQNQSSHLKAANARQAAAESNFQAASRSAKADWSGLKASHTATARRIEIFNDKLASLEEQNTTLRNNYESGIGIYAPILDTEIATLNLRGDISAEKARLVELTARANSLLVMP